jgi:hypothetical protein
MENISTILSNPTINQLAKQRKEVDREGIIGMTSDMKGREPMLQKEGINAPETYPPFPQIILNKSATFALLRARCFVNSFPC